MRQSLGGNCDNILFYIYTMTTISILTLNNAVLASIADSRYVFTMANQFLTQSGRKPLFNVQLVGLTKEVKLNNGLFCIHPDLVLEEVKQNNLIIIPSLTGDMMSATHVNKDYAHWIAQQYKNGAAVASLCNGAFLLAFSGLLKGKQFTTHCLYANQFKHFYPSVKLVDEKVITVENGLYFSRRRKSYLHLLIPL